MKPFSSLSIVMALVVSLAVPAMAQKPGTPLSAGTDPVPPGNTLTEPTPSGALGTLQPMLIHDIGTTVKNGFLILLNTRVNPLDPRTWRDVVGFCNVPSAPDCGPYGYGRYAVLISGAVGEVGISDSDLSQFPAAYAGPVTTAYIVSLFSSGCVSLLGVQPSGVTTYSAGTASYTIFSAPDQATPVSNRSWGRMKLIYR
jgi:hypothetical protein